MMEKNTYGMCWMARYSFLQENVRWTMTNTKPLLAKSQTFGRTPCLRRFRKRMLQNKNETYILTKNIFNQIISAYIAEWVIWFKEWNRQITRLIGKKIFFENGDISNEHWCNFDEKYLSDQNHDGLLFWNFHIYLMLC